MKFFIVVFISFLMYPKLSQADSGRYVNFSLNDFRTSESISILNPTNMSMSGTFKVEKVSFGVNINKYFFIEAGAFLSNLDKNDIRNKNIRDNWGENFILTSGVNYNLGGKFAILGVANYVGIDTRIKNMYESIKLPNYQIGLSYKLNSEISAVMYWNQVKEKQAVQNLENVMKVVLQYKF